ncbi:unnamed protein product [Psylliodes chrysocephalus]|uniref:Alpha-endosulfine n=1 Tax=Psylliodes chrysocephalus TaxID=3402493 RepID=A0A9P0G8B6_9CUCU|nr:unnamed protein product [Psylliodes chrysocephala]
MSGQEQESNEPQFTPQEVEKQEEAKLKAKYSFPPGGGPALKASGHSAFLQKRLSKGQKYFDSGDYQMAKQKFGNITNKPGLPLPGPNSYVGTGDTIPTPDTVPIRKTSIVQPSKFSNVS